MSRSRDETSKSNEAAAKPLKSDEAAVKPLRVIDVEATIKNRERGGIYFKKRWGAWHVISHTWSAGIRKFSETVGVRVGAAAGGSSSYEELFDRADFSREKSYKDLIEFLEILRTDGVSWAWFDALCINQKDDKEKEAEIQHMGAYYEGSLGCYVAQHGIGMGFEVLDNFSGAAAADAWLSWYVRGECDAFLPRWFTRAWTFQEWVLPKKVVFIVEGLDIERLTSASESYRDFPDRPCLDFIHLRPIQGQQGLYFTTDKDYLSLVELYSSFTKVALGERIQLYKRMMAKFPRHFKITTEPEINAGIDVHLVVNEISQRDASNEEDRVLSILKLLGVEDVFQVRANKGLREQVIHLTQTLVRKPQQEVLLQLCLADVEGNDWQGMSWAPTFNVLQGERISIPGLQRYFTRSPALNGSDRDWVIKRFWSAGTRVVEVSDNGCLKLESKVLQGELNIQKQRAELTVAGRPFLSFWDLGVPSSDIRGLPDVFVIFARFAESEAWGGVVCKGPGLYEKICKLSPKIRVWLVCMGSATLARRDMRHSWRHYTYFLVCISATDGGGTPMLHKVGYFALIKGSVMSIVNSAPTSTVTIGGFGADVTPYVLLTNSGSA